MNIFSQLKAPKNEVESEVGTTPWLTAEDIKELSTEPKQCNMMDVYQAMQDNVEGMYVYLDNVDLKALNITEQQFAGYCSALTKAGLYVPVDKFFGKVL